MRTGENVANQPSELAWSLPDAADAPQSASFARGTTLPPTHAGVSVRRCQRTAV